jgi:septal ring factor EnvC (AmiA/AmiB activator)
VLNIQLTDDQKAALKMCWSRVKANKAALTEQHSKLSERLAELQLLQQQVQFDFEEQAAQLQGLQAPYGVQQKQRIKEAVVQQQQVQQLSPTLSTPTAAAAAAAAAVQASHELPVISCSSGTAAVAASPDVSGDLPCIAETARSSFGSAMNNPEGLLLPVSCL